MTAVGNLTSALIFAPSTLAHSIYSFSRLITLHLAHSFIHSNLPLLSIPLNPHTPTTKKKKKKKESKEMIKIQTHTPKIPNPSNRNQGTQSPIVRISLPNSKAAHCPPPSPPQKNQKQKHHPIFYLSKRGSSS